MGGGVTEFVLERTCPQEHLNLSKLAFVSKEGHSGCKSTNIAKFWTRKLFQISTCVISARKAKHLDATTMFTYSHAITPLGQLERAYYLSYFINDCIACWTHCKISFLDTPSWLSEDWRATACPVILRRAGGSIRPRRDYIEGRCKQGIRPWKTTGYCVHFIQVYVDPILKWPWCYSFHIPQAYDMITGFWQ